MSERRPTTWLHDRREASWFRLQEGGRTYTVRVTPKGPGVSGYWMECEELPGWRGACAYALPDERDNSQFQFWMQTRDLRALPRNTPETTQTGVNKTGQSG